MVVMITETVYRKILALFLANNKYSLNVIVDFFKSSPSFTIIETQRFLNVTLKAIVLLLTLFKHQYSSTLGNINHPQ